MELELDFNKFMKMAADGVVNEFEGNYKRQQDLLAEFQTKQRQLLHTLDKELANFKSSESVQLEDMMLIVKACQTRLHIIKGRMRKSSATASKLKARSLRIQQIKQKEALDRELQREAQLNREQEMVAKSPLCHDSVYSP